MAAVSDNKYDVFNWIIKVYDSCQTIPQLLTMYKLVQNFRKTYDDYKLYSELDDYHFEVADRLIQKVDKKTKKQLLKG
jgi:hypothetical protein